MTIKDQLEIMTEIEKKNKEALEAFLRDEKGGEA